MSRRPPAADEPEPSHAMRGQAPVRPVELEIAAVAANQDGMVARWQLREIGMTARQIDRRLQRGSLHVVFRAVYAVGHRAITVRGWWRAAVLSAGPGAVLSHAAAAALHGIRPYAGVPDVTVPADRRSRPGLRYHQALLAPDEVTTVDGIPVTTVPRTLFDLAAVLGKRQVARAVHEAEVLRLYDALPLVDMVARYPGRRGVVTTRAILRDRGEAPGHVVNDFEDDFDAFLDARGLPRGRKNAWIFAGDRWYQVDCVWEEQRVAAELDGRRTHDTTEYFGSDRVRDRKLTIAGWRPTRITPLQLYGGPDGLAADLRDLWVNPRRAGTRLRATRAPGRAR